MTATLPYRPLGLIKELLENHGFSVTHCYEELIFVEGNTFLIQMGEKGEEVNLIFNVDYDTDKRNAVEQALSLAGLKFGLQIEVKGTYSLSPNEEDSTISIEFHK